MSKPIAAASAGRARFIRLIIWAPAETEQSGMAFYLKLASQPVTITARSFDCLSQVDGRPEEVFGKCMVGQQPRVVGRLAQQLGGLHALCRIGQ
jgi:hypothetical protein